VKRDVKRARPARPARSTSALNDHDNIDFLTIVGCAGGAKDVSAARISVRSGCARLSAERRPRPAAGPLLGGLLRPLLGGLHRALLRGQLRSLHRPLLRGLLRRLHRPLLRGLLRPLLDLQLPLLLEL
jgi:hypothetical protein